MKFQKSNDMEEILDAGFRSVPVLKVDGVYLGFSDAIKYVNKYE